tara:strand:- start:45 stop:320 length:276 start_codon:yes stop_codon:yes gene_type:complete
METPQLNFDMISKILNIRMNSKKDERYKNNFNDVVKNLNNMFEDVHDSDCKLSIGDPESKYFIECVLDRIVEENQTVQRPYMPWENEWSGY